MTSTRRRCSGPRYPGESNPSGSRPSPTFPRRLNATPTLDSLNQWSAYAHYGGNGCRMSSVLRRRYRLRSDPVARLHADVGSGLWAYYVDGQLVGLSSDQVYSKPERWHCTRAVGCRGGRKVAVRRAHVREVGLDRDVRMMMRRGRRFTLRHRAHAIFTKTAGSDGPGLPEQSHAGLDPGHLRARSTVRLCNATPKRRSTSPTSAAPEDSAGAERRNSTISSVSRNGPRRPRRCRPSPPSHAQRTRP